LCQHRLLSGFRAIQDVSLESKHTFAAPVCPAVAGTWTNLNTGTYLGTIAFAYLSFVMFILFFLGLVMFQSAVNEELGLRKCTQTSGATACLVMGCHTQG
jgi:hypothetical protein